MGLNQPSLFFSIFFSSICTLKLVVMKYTWVHSTFSLATNSFLYCHPLGKPLHSYSKVPLVALNTGTQPLSCSNMALSFDHLPQPHSRTSARGS